MVARDAASPLTRVEFSRDGDEWHMLAPQDGLLDGREEEFRFPGETGRHLVVVRAVDQQHNRVVVGSVEK